jgi:MFS family permease
VRHPRLPQAGLAGTVLVGAVSLARTDAGLVGALAPVLRRDLQLSTFRLGLLASASSIVGAAVALPAGRLADTRNRGRLLLASVALWALATAVAGSATNLAILFGARLFGGAVASVARPVAVSVLGDRHGPDERVGVLSRLDAGQNLGAITCFVLAAGATALGHWRLAFFATAGAGLVLVASAGRPGPDPRPSIPGGPPPLSHLLRIRTNLVVLASDAVGNVFYTGVATFGVLFATERYHLGVLLADTLAPVVALAVIAGVLLGGRAGDALGRARGGASRLGLACGADLAAAVALVPGFTGAPLPVASASILVGALALGVAGPCLDAVRVDVVPPALRGRAESTRSLLLLASGAAGPVTIGALARAVGVGGALLLMLVPLGGAGLVLLAARRSYGPDAGAAERGATPAGSGDLASRPASARVPRSSSAPSMGSDARRRRTQVLHDPGDDQHDNHHRHDGGRSEDGHDEQR